MGYIFCIMGMSSTGKDTLFYHLNQHFKDVLSPIVLYTTRPKRTHETSGVEYHFITERELAVFEEQHKVIERRSYDTVQGIWHYASIDDGQIDLMQHSYLTIITLEAFTSFKQFFGAERVIPLYIEVEETERVGRAISREKKQEKPDFEEMNRRMRADLEDFSADKLGAVGVFKHYINTDLKTCVAELTQTIEMYLGREHQ